MNGLVLKWSTLSLSAYNQEHRPSAANGFLFSPVQQEFLLKIFCVFRNLMKMSVFPRDWMVMRLLTSK